jgi:Fe-S-cluster containining protein
MIKKGIAEIKAFQAQTGLEYGQKLYREFSLSCTKGCAYCCHHPFLITIVEGMILYQYLASHGYLTSSFRKALKKNRSKTLGLSFEVWLLSNIPCPLLENNECVAYEARPLHCRVTYSRGDPLMCHSHELRYGTLLFPNEKIITEYNQTLQAKLKRLELPQNLMPVSEALLLSDSMETGALEIADLMTQYFKDFNA